MGKNLIYIAAHNNQEQTLPYSIASWRWYTERYNLDFKIANKQIHSDFKVGGFCAYEKWYDEEILSSNYDKILIVDSDVIVRWDTPNIFETFPKIEFGMVLDGGGEVGPYHFKQWEEIENITTLNQTQYYNSGILLTTLNNYKTINKHIPRYFDYWQNQYIKNKKNPDAIDQTPVNIIGQKIIGKISTLPNIWNNMVMSKYDDASFINDSYVWHFTGPKMGGWSNKANIMEQIWEHIKDQYV
jgi:lipopolysaccharide biosynthesis glycosyltransferase